MNSMLPAESAILSGFQSLRMILFLLRSIVVTLLALCTCQCNLHAHNFHLQFFNYAFFFMPGTVSAAVSRDSRCLFHQAIRSLRFFRHKKKTYSIASLIYHTGRPESIFFFLFIREIIRTPFQNMSSISPDIFLLSYKNVPNAHPSIFVVHKLSTAHCGFCG